MTEILVVAGIIALLAAIAVPAAISQRRKATEAQMSGDLLSVSTSVESALTGWRGKPPTPAAPNDYLPIATTDGMWSLTKDGVAQASGKTSAGTTITGRLWSNGAYCLQAANNGTNKTSTLRSDTQKVEFGTCPTTIIGSPLSEDVTSDAGTPPAITGLSATSPGPNQIQVTFDRVPEATSYSVTVANVSTVDVPQPTSGTTATTTLSSIPPGVMTVTVRAKNANGGGPGASTTLSVTGSTMFPTGVTTPLTAAGSGSVGLLLGADGNATGPVAAGVAASNTGTIRFNTNLAHKNSWISGTPNGDLLFMTSSSGATPTINLDLGPGLTTIPTGLRFNAGFNNYNGSGTSRTAFLTAAGALTTASLDTGATTITGNLTHTGTTASLRATDVTTLDASGAATFATNITQAAGTAALRATTVTTFSASSTATFATNITQSAGTAALRATTVTSLSSSGTATIASTLTVNGTSNLSAVNADSLTTTGNIAVGGTITGGSAWTSLPLVNGWASYGNPYAYAGYRTFPTGEVCLRGLVRNTGNAAATGTFATLPTSVAPPAWRIFTGVANNGYARIDVQATGDVKVASYRDSGSAGYVSLEGICWDS